MTRRERIAALFRRTPVAAKARTVSLTPIFDELADELDLEGALS